MADAQVVPSWPVPVLAGFALCMFVAVGMFTVESRRLIEHGHVAEGRVVDVDTSTSDAGIPIVMFDADGREVRARVANPLGHSHRTGDGLRVRFEPADPEHARSDTFAGVWAQVVISAAVAVSLLAAAVVFWVLRRRALLRTIA